MLVVMGLPGVGKSSVLKGALEGRDIKVINYGDVAIEVAKKRKMTTDRDALISLPVKAHLELQDAVVAQLKDAPKTILDTHAVLKRRPSGYIPGLTPSLFKKVTIDALVFIDAPSDEIARRRKADPARARPAMTVEELDEIRRFSLSAISVYSASTGAPIYVITNREGRSKEAIRGLRDIFDSLGWE
ncbi:Adenylate kinase [uncultured archaeon]|nr:Adenylate kinase [uncultured archaeon]